jgi:hypothetical protein
VRSAAAINVTILPILFPDLSSAANQSDPDEVKAAAERSAASCVGIFVSAGRPLPLVEIGQEWDNVCILPGASGDVAADYNETCTARMAAVLGGMAKGVRAAAPGTRIGVNSGG